MIEVSNAIVNRVWVGTDARDDFEVFMTLTDDTTVYQGTVYRASLGFPPALTLCKSGDVVSFTYVDDDGQRLCNFVNSSL